MTLKTARGRALEVALITRVTNSLVHRLLVLTQRCGCFEDVATNLAGMFAAAVLKSFVNTQRVRFVRNKIAEIALQRHLNVGLVMYFEIVPK